MKTEGDDSEAFESHGVMEGVFGVCSEVCSKGAPEESPQILSDQLRALAGLDVSDEIKLAALREIVEKWGAR